MPVADCVDRIFAVSHVRYDSSAGPAKPKRTRCQKKIPAAEVMERQKLGPSPASQVAMARNTAAATTATRTIIDRICSLTIDCRCDTCIEGMMRYQWPRIKIGRASCRE